MESLHTPPEVVLQLGRRLEALRLAQDWRRTTLAERAGVSASTIARFETTGAITLENFARLAWALGRLDELAGLLSPAAAGSLRELERRSSPRRKRGRS